MPSCVVPGCTTGYGGVNPEKKHFFSIPKDTERQALWKKAFQRDDKFVTTKAYVCEKHFVPDDILWHRKLLAPDGRELGVSQLKIPRLKPDAVPSVFSWNQKIKESETSNYRMDEDQHSAVIDSCKQHFVMDRGSSNASLAEPLEPADTKRPRLELDDREEESSKTPNLNPSREERGYENPVIEDESFNNFINDNVGTLENRNMQFTLLQLLAMDTDLPLGWTREDTELEGSRLSIYLKHLTFKTTKATQTVVWKSITIQEDVSIEVSILGEPLNLETFDFPSVVISAEQFRKLLSSVHALKVCSGCTGSSVQSEIDRLQCRNIKKDIVGTWRRDTCTLLVSNTSICRSCQITKKNLADRIRKWKQGKTKNLRNRNQEEKRVLSKTKAKYCRAAYAKKQALRKIAKLKMELRDKKKNQHTKKTAKFYRF